MHGFAAEDAVPAFEKSCISAALLPIGLGLSSAF